MKRFVAVVVLYAVLAVAATHPLWQRMGDALPGDVGDPVLNTYILAWDAHALVVDPANLFNANFFFPLRGTLAFSENLSGTALLALPLMLLSGEPVLTYNLVFLASFVLAGAGMYLLVLRITRQPLAAAAAGIAFAFAPYHIASLAHLQLLTIGWLPLLVLALDRVLWAPAGARRWGAGVLFCVFLWMQAASTLHGALFAALILLGFGAVHVRRLGAFLHREFMLPLVACACLLLPVIMPYVAVLDALRAARPPDVALSFSAQPSDFLAAYPDNRWFGALTAALRARPGFSEEQTLFMGIAAPLLALTALAGAGLARTRRSTGKLRAPNTNLTAKAQLRPEHRSGRREESPFGFIKLGALSEVAQAGQWAAGLWNEQAGDWRWTVFFAALALLSLLLASSGALAQALPLAGVMRVPARWVGVLTFALAGLAGMGVAMVEGHLVRLRGGRPSAGARAKTGEGGGKPRPYGIFEKMRTGGTVSLVVAACLAALLYLEGYAAPVPLAEVGSLREQPAIYDYLAQLPGREAVLELPMYTGTHRESAESKRMVASAVHWRPLVNGYSGVTPPQTLALAAELQGFPDDRALAATRALGRLGVRYVIVHAGEPGIPRRDWNQANRAKALAGGMLKLVRTFNDNDLLEIVNP